MSAHTITPSPATAPKRWWGRFRTRTIVIAAVVLAALMIGALVAAMVLPRLGASADSSDPLVRTATVTRGTVQKTITATGTLTPSVIKGVDFAVSGRVTAVSVSEGDVVEKGDVLAKIDPLRLTAALAAAKADLAEARANLAERQSSSDGGSAAAARISAASAAVDVAIAAVEDAEEDLARATLTAPVSGLVTEVSIDVGDAVGSSSGIAETGGSTAAFTIVSTDAWRVDVTVSESDAALIATGNPVALVTDDGVELTGTVGEVGMLPTTSSGTAAFPVVIDIEGTADGLYDGIAVTADLIYEQREDVLTVPSAAVVAASDGTGTVSLVASDGTVAEVSVEVGESDGTGTEILSGLAEGDTVLVTAFTPGDGNAGGGQFPEGFPGGEMPDGFPGGEMPEGFPGSGGMPDGFPGGGTQGGGMPGGMPGSAGESGSR